MYHKIILVGNLGRDPDMKFLGSGTAVTNFSMATSEKWTGQDGQQQERTIWWRVAVWGKSAEACNQFLKKGSKVLVEGRMNATPEGNPRMWKDNSGNDRASFEVTAVAVKFLSSRGEGGGGGMGSGTMENEPQDETEIPF